jgi:hypothetical protein
VREKYCWLAGGWWLMLNWCERKALLAGQPAEQGLYSGLMMDQNLHDELFRISRFSSWKPNALLAWFIGLPLFSSYEL